MNLQVCNVLFNSLRTSSDAYYSLPTPRSSRMASRTVLLAKFSSGAFNNNSYTAIGAHILLSRCNNVLYIISPPVSAYQIFLLTWKSYIQRGTARRVTLVPSTLFLIYEGYVKWAIFNPPKLPQVLIRVQSCTIGCNTHTITQSKQYVLLICLCLMMAYYVLLICLCLMMAYVRLKPPWSPSGCRRK